MPYTSCLSKYTADMQYKAATCASKLGGDRVKSSNSNIFKKIQEWVNDPVAWPGRWHGTTIECYSSILL